MYVKKSFEYHEPLTLCTKGKVEIRNLEKKISFLSLKAHQILQLENQKLFVVDRKPLSMI